MLEKTEERLDSEAVIEEFESLTKDAGKVQKEILKRILQENGEIEYLLKFGLDGKTDPASFKARVPIVTHEDLEPYIRRIADGEKSSILSAKPISTISLSSGTTQGKPKYVPFNDALIDSTMQIYKTSFAFRNREYPIIGNGKALQFIYGSKQFKTNGGLTAGTATTNVYRNTEFKKTMHAMQTPCSSPDEVIFGNNFQESLYCHLLCGLIFSDEIQVVSSTFAHSIVHAFRTFETIWPQLVTDIRDGVLSSRISSLNIRSAMEKVLVGPNPKLGDTIHRKCLGLSNWYGLIPEIFPNVKYVYGIMTGSMEGYVGKLRHYAGGELALVSGDYGSSEGWIGVNVNPRLSPEMATFAVLPNIGYFEFVEMGLPEEAAVVAAAAQPVGLTEVEVGKEYEIIVTTFAGLYRYRLGDIVKVKGFHNSTPELQFICRSNLVLNINLDKTTEKDLQLAVNTSANLLAGEKLELVDFTSFADRSTDPGNYVIFWETTANNNNNNDEIMQECCNCLDRSFVDAGYVSSRRVNSIGKLELKILKRGTFNKIMDYYVGLGSAVSQFKTPRFIGINNHKVLNILSTNVVNTYSSTAFD
ncbi:hypothetical protein ABFX02_14G139300 [Erythranthe guttata]